MSAALPPGLAVGGGVMRGSPLVGWRARGWMLGRCHLCRGTDTA